MKRWRFLGPCGLLGFLLVHPLGPAKGEHDVRIATYKKNSFAPIRGESFRIPVRVANFQRVKSIGVELWTGDGDLVRTLPLISSPKKNGGTYDAVWDGRDEARRIVPNEAYHPVLLVRRRSNRKERFDSRLSTGGEEVYDFQKKVRPGVIEYTLPVASRLLIRSGIKNGPMLRTVVDWEPRTAGFHRERWSGRDADNVIAIDQMPQVGYLVLGYKLPEHSIIAYGNDTETYRSYREKKGWPVRQPVRRGRQRDLERAGKPIRREYYNPILKQKSPRIDVNLLQREGRACTDAISGFEEVITEITLEPLDEMYLDQDRYEISFFVDHEFIAEEEQGFVPFNWRWSPRRMGIKAGRHILTINLSGYNGQVGVRNVAFTLLDSPVDPRQGNGEEP